MIGIDGNEANVSQRVGSNVYAYKILTGLADLYRREQFQVYLKTNPVSDLPAQTSNWNYKILGKFPLWTQWRLPLELYLRSPRPKLIFTPGHYAPRFTPVPSVVTILDLAFLYFPEAFQPKVLKQLKAWTEYSVRQASHILTISQHSKRDIIREYGVDSDQITVTHLASDLQPPAKWNQTERDKIMKKYAIPTKFFLFIGTRQPRKNLDRLIEAFLKVHAKQRNISLVIAGKTWHQFSDAQIKTHPQIVMTGYVPDEDIPALILSSEALVFPSLYEGFGLPVLEAMQLGTLVSASNTSSIPEITGKSELSFDPQKTDQIAQSLAKVLSLDTNTKKKIIRQGKILSKQFTWDKTVEKTKAVLDGVRN